MWLDIFLCLKPLLGGVEELVLVFTGYYSCDTSLAFRVPPRGCTGPDTVVTGTEEAQWKGTGRETRLREDVDEFSDWSSNTGPTSRVQGVGYGTTSRLVPT